VTLKAIREEIKSILLTVPDVGKVYDYIPYTADWQRFIANFKHNGRINGWTITRRETSESVTSVTGVNSRTHFMMLQGYRSLDESIQSEKIYQDLVDSVCAALRDKYNLNGKALKVDPPQVLVVEHKMFGSVLCHYAEIQLNVTEREVF